MVIFALALFGLILGSFVNALVWRIHKQTELTGKGHKKGQPSANELSMLKGRSMCSNCHRELAAKDLVPLFSWLWLRGKCRYCQKPIQDSPWIEVVMPLLFVASYLAWPLALEGLGLYQFIFWLVFLVGFMALAVYDLRWYLLPNRIVFPLIALAVAQLVGQFIFFDGGLDELWSALWGVTIASGIFYVLYQLSGGTWIGGGDVKLGIVLGLLLGGPLASMLMLFVASLLGTLAALPQLLNKKTGMKSQIPFGPFLLAATYIVMLYGDRIIDAYYRFAGIA